MRMNVRPKKVTAYSTRGGLSLNVVRAMVGPECHVSSQTFVQHFGRQSLDAAHHFTRPMNPIRQQSIDRQRPFTPIDRFDLSGALLRSRLSRDFFTRGLFKIDRLVPTTPDCTRCRHAAPLCRLRRDMEPFYHNRRRRSFDATSRSPHRTHCWRIQRNRSCHGETVAQVNHSNSDCGQPIRQTRPGAKRTGLGRSSGVVPSEPA